MYNGHIHIFNGKFAPDDFLKVGIPGARFDGIADNIKAFMETRFGRNTLKFLLAHGSRRHRVKRLLTFFEIGLEASQRKVFDRIHAVYKGHDPRYFVLTMNMDFMTDTASKHTPFETQLQEVFELKQTYQNELLVFLNCDPRYKRGVELREWFKRYYEDGKVVGIKLYPPLGYFPFDPAFVELFEYASQHKIPVLTHTTRTGVFYIGKNPKQFVGDKPATFMNHPIMSSVYSRIAKYNNSKHRKLKLNDHYCNIFSHPENYLPMIESFPGLKLCFAHYGGTNEILGTTESFMLEVENDKSINWTNLIRDYIRKYPNVYSDISYALANKDTHKVFINDLADPKIRERLFFGTDYFMEEQEESEVNVFADFRNSFLPHPEYYKSMTEINPHRFVFG